MNLRVLAPRSYLVKPKVKNYNELLGQVCCVQGVWVVNECRAIADL
jgi:hypothetical protein